jgi:hypothetical protein
MTPRLEALRLAALGGAAALALWDARRKPSGLSRRLFGAASVVALLWVTIAVAQHWRFPLHLDVMEGAVLQHAMRAAEGQPIYPWPTPDYSPLAYNPLLYLLAAPLLKLTGPSLPAIRLIAILGMAGSALLVGLVVRRRSGSAWWGLIGAGLFAAAYGAMDAYLDTAHSDSWLLCSALLGTWLLERAEGWPGRVAGTLVLVASFWFKQHGALFAMGGVAYLFWRDGPRRGFPCLLLAGVAGPLLYLLAQPWPMGAAFHYFTWQVPGGWSTPTLGGPVRVLNYTLTWYPALAVATGAALVAAFRNGRAAPDPWLIQLVPATLTAVLGVLDIGSANNVFIPFGTWLILLGVPALATLLRDGNGRWRRPAATLAVGASFACLIYDPRAVLMSPRAQAAYADLTALLRGLPGTVYAPYITYLPDVPTLYPRVHWVSVDDIARSGHGSAESRARVDSLMAPARDPRGEAWIITNYPLEGAARPVRALAPCYRLVEDFGDRFLPLLGTPRRFSHGWPRYLYRHTAAGTPDCRLTLRPSGDARQSP